MRRTGPVHERVLLRLRSVGMGTWSMLERLGLDVGGTEGPSAVVDPQRRAAFADVVRSALGSDRTIDGASCPYPLHELLTYLVSERGVLLHGSNHRTLDVLEPRPARDLSTQLHAVVATDDAIWPMFYAVIARDRVGGVFTACTHVGRAPRLRRFYMFAMLGDPQSPSMWTPGVLYVLPRAGFSREWGREWVSEKPARPLLRVLVEPEDFPLRDAVVGLSEPRELRRVVHHLRAAKRKRQPRSK